jgi:hypothetical protein
MRFDHVEVHVRLLDEDHACQRAKAVRRHPVVRIPHAPQCRAQRVLAHAAFTRERAGEHAPAMPAERMFLVAIDRAHQRADDGRVEHCSHVSASGKLPIQGKRSFSMRSIQRAA